jgi:two-component system, chemotaxis family, protein-glutamate methylesterase/glutaminase
MSHPDRALARQAPVNILSRMSCAALDPHTARKLLTAAMDRPNIVVIGGSAGALEPLQEVVASLREKWAIAVFVVIHAWPDSPGELVPLLARAGSLRVKSAQDRDPITRGTLLVAPPDQHLILKDGFVRVTRSPRENLWRPAVDVLFRSAAVAYGAQVIGVILSGALNDGSAGGCAIKRCGGTVIVQSPEDARFPDMPRAAVRATPVDYVIPHKAISAAIHEVLARTPSESPLVPHDLVAEVQFAETRPFPLCTQARGPGEIESRDAALWAAIRHFEQRADWYSMLACEQQARGHTRAALIYGDRAREAQVHAFELRKLLFRAFPVVVA